MSLFKEVLGDKAYQKVWEEADDVIETSRTLDEVYNDVPEDLKGISIQVMEIHKFPNEYRERMLAFLES